ncbi:hypothetical protein ACFL6T_00105 [Candidatus Zixiibacteriota bacterium]
MTGVSTTVALRDSRRELPSILLLLLAMTLYTIIPSDVEAQYRGGRKPPEKALKRAGLLFFEAGIYWTTPGRDFAGVSSGAASAGTGWRVNVGSWLGGGFTAELEWGVFDNDRFNTINPWYLQTFSNVTGMDFRNSYLLPLLRINVLTDRKIIPYVLGGIGKVRSSFSVHFMQNGRSQIMTQSVNSTLTAVGVGWNLVIADHATMIAEWRSFEWFNDSLIPSIRYWSVSRLGLALSWHF